MKLCELLHVLKEADIRGSRDVEVTKVCCDSRRIEKGALFVCIRGNRTDGHNFAQDAVDAGALVLVLEKDFGSQDSTLKERMKKTEEMLLARGGAVLEVPCTRHALAFLSAAFFGHPARFLTTIGITGTKGKTTTAYLIHSVLTQAGLRVGLIGTIETIIGEEHIPAENTTPESCFLQETLFRMVEAGMDAVVMEVSSQGLKLARTAGFVFDYGIFTNLGEDHIGPGEHRDLEEYMECKSRLFRQCRIGIVNCDDIHWKRIVQEHTCLLETYGFSEEAKYQAIKTSLLREKERLAVQFEVRMPCGVCEEPFETATPGKFSVYNSLAAIVLCGHFGVENKLLRQVLKTTRVKGRMEPVAVPGGYTLLIDYAHNAMSLESLLETLREYQPKRLLCLFGCGGNRSRLRRIEMGQVSGKLADLTILTSDNPRFEEPLAILKDIKEGILTTGGSFVEIEDRREAIAYAMGIATPGDILVLAGKGHETYQEIKGEKYPMDERELIRRILTKEGT